MSAPPVVSIGVPVYNGGLLLRRTLESLLAQTYPYLEIIITNNASTDETDEIAREFAALDPRVRYIANEKNIGAIPNFLKGLSLASGKYFTWTAADDVRPPDAIERCVDALEAQPNCVMAHGPLVLEVPGRSTTLQVENRADISHARPRQRVRAFTKDVDHVGFMFGVHRREALQQVHYGNHMAGDYFVCLQMSQRGPIAWVPTPILIYRHRFGALDNPMYARQPISVRDLLLHRGVRRRKCWMALGIGCYYLWRANVHVGMSERLQTVRTFASSFATRFPAELGTELVYLACSPVSWAVVPLMPLGRKLKRLTGNQAATAR